MMVGKTSSAPTGVVTLMFPWGQSHRANYTATCALTPSTSGANGRVDGGREVHEARHANATFENRCLALPEHVPGGIFDVATLCALVGSGSGEAGRGKGGEREVASNVVSG